MSTFLLPYEKLEDRWDPKAYAFLRAFWNTNFEFVKIWKLLENNRENISLEEDKFYKQITIKIYHKWVILRWEQKWRDIKTRPQFKVKAWQFILSKIDAKDWAFWIIPDYLDWWIITWSFVSFDIKRPDILSIDYFDLLLSQDFFLNILKSKSVWTTWRKPIMIDEFLDLEIPLPSLGIQEKIVKTYNDIKTEISELENENQNLLKEVDNYLMKELGIEIEQKAKKKFFCVGYEDLERWDVLNFINKRNSFNKYEYKKLSDIYNFKSRKWNKNNSDDWKFHYIEIWNIDAEIWLNWHTELQIREAPSRATQIVKTWDLMISTTRPYLKKFAIVDDNYDWKICSSWFSIIENSDKYDLDFLKYLLQSNYWVDILKDNMTWWLYPAITQKALENLEFPIPTLDIQKNIINWINNIKNKSKLNGERIEKLKVDLDEKIKGMILDGKL